MNHNPLGLLAALLPYAGDEIAAAQFAGASNLGALLQAGWLVRTGWPVAALCSICDEPHPAELIERTPKPLALCMRKGETFIVPEEAALYRLDADAVALGLALALTLDGRARKVKGIPSLWRLGDRRLMETRVVFFFTPEIAELDIATTILDAVVAQSGASRSCLIVASDSLGHVRLLSRKVQVLSLRAVASFAPDGSLVVDDTELVTMVLPDLVNGRSRGAPAIKRDKILPILDAMGSEGVTVDDSSATCREVRARFRRHHPNDRAPVTNTIKAAIRSRR